MDTFLYILIILTFLTSIGSFLLLVAVGVFLVRLRSFLSEFFSDLVDMISMTSPVVPPPDDPKQKTWDEKFEEEIAERERRMKEEMGGLKNP